jgi:DNA mismatch repair ATPase MutS
VENEDVAFLYKLVAGNCPGSFGLSVARKMGLPQEILETAALASSEMEKEIKKKILLSLIAAFRRGELTLEELQAREALVRV